MTDKKTLPPPEAFNSLPPPQKKMVGLEDDPGFFFGFIGN